MRQGPMFGRILFIFVCRCDRILYKTTVQPEAEESSVVADTPTRSRPGLKQLLVKALHPRSRSLSQDFTSSTSAKSSKLVTPTSPSHPEPPDFPPSPQSLKHATLGPNDLHDTLTVGASSGADTITRRRTPSRMNFAARGALTLDSKLPRCFTEDPSSRRSQSRSVVWGILPSLFLSSSPRASTSELVPQLPKAPQKPRKGEMVCLSYKTLDDRGMHRLEGRSDHRPVIGTFAVYF